MTDLPIGTVTFLFTDIEDGGAAAPFPRSARVGTRPRSGQRRVPGPGTQLWGQHPDAMRLALARHDACLTASLRADYDRAVAAARAALGEEAFAAAWEEGRAMTLEDAMCAALAEDEIPTTGRQGSEEDPGVTELT